MDGIQAYKGDAAPPSTSRPSIRRRRGVNPAAVKSTSNYLKALKRRFWVVLAVAVPLAITTSILVLKLPPVYMVKAEIEINPPELDPLAHDARRDRGRPPRRIEPGQLRGQPRSQAAEPGSSPSGSSATRRIAPKVSQYADPAFELVSSSLVVQQVKKSPARSSSPWKATTRL